LNNSLGNSGVGIDLDQFVSKCIYFMKSGGHIAGEEDAPAVPVTQDDDNEDPDGLDWALLGRQACFPCNKRPPTSSFLLGPLSVQKKVRVTQRKARSQREKVGPATRPEEIKEVDIQQNEQSNLSNLVKGIRSQLRDHIEHGSQAVEEELEDTPDIDDDEEGQVAAFRRHRISMAPDQEAAVGLLDFAINPRDFGQTVENLFYISFLVREGNAKVVQDDDGLPLLSKFEAHRWGLICVLTPEQYQRIHIASPRNGRTASRSIKRCSVSTTRPGRCLLKHSTSESRSYRIARTNMAKLVRMDGTADRLSTSSLSSLRPSSSVHTWRVHSHHHTRHARHPFRLYPSPHGLFFLLAAFGSQSHARCTVHDVRQAAILYAYFGFLISHFRSALLLFPASLSTL
jgi:hypothetical protein